MNDPRASGDAEARAPVTWCAYSSLRPHASPTCWRTTGGMSVQRTDRNGRSWTTCPLLRIWRFGGQLAQPGGARVAAGLRSGDGPWIV